MNNAHYASTLEGIERKISGVVDRLEALEVRIPPVVHEPDGNEQDEHARHDEELQHRLHRNRQGMCHTLVPKGVNRSFHTCAQDVQITRTADSKVK
jgi:hypothetical protein